jgi:hypothetical protein
MHTSITNNESDEDVTLSNANESDDEDTPPTRPGISTDIHPSPRKNIPPSKTTTGISALVTQGIRPSTVSGPSTVSSVVRQPVVKAKATTEKFNSDR